mmetsp:Transcript_8513/g.16621  ORF Transcript_8513/g.16621 Transcript_8513/m.16621 type:complete len:221 (-) Transcript_8513:2518-3180(-)
MPLLRSAIPAKNFCSNCSFPIPREAAASCLISSSRRLSVLITDPSNIFFPCATISSPNFFPAHQPMQKFIIAGLNMATNSSFLYGMEASMYASTTFSATPFKTSNASANSGSSGGSSSSSSNLPSSYTAAESRATSRSGERVSKRFWKSISPITSSAAVVTSQAILPFKVITFPSGPTYSRRRNTRFIPRRSSFITRCVCSCNSFCVCSLRISNSILCCW